MIELLHVLPTLKAAGAESLVANMIINMQDRRIRVHVCVLYPPTGTRLEAELCRRGVPVYYLKKHRGFDIRMFGRLNCLIRRLKPDIVHTHNYVMRYTLLPTILQRVPVRMHTVHNMALREVEWAGRIVHWIAFRMFRCLPVGISEAVSRSVDELYGVGTPTIYNGIPLRHFLAVKQPRRSESDDVVFINVSWFRPQKGHRFLVTAFAAAAKVRPGIKLLLVGNGPLRKNIEKIVRAENLSDRILFLGLRDDIAGLLARSDVYVSSSEWEGFGLTIVEAMAAGRPVIATAVDGVPEIVHDKVTGLLVPSGDVESMSTAIAALADDCRLRAEMGKRGRVRAEKMFDIVKTTVAYEEMYTAAVERAAKG
ncbi:glycosyltransferase [candidate division WOR-3 bacterium]|nr:glycosyltransferase [candidate division WOR-3 bacterium]